MSDEMVVLTLTLSDMVRLSEMVEVSDWNLEQDKRIVAAIDSRALGGPEQRNG